MRSEQEMLELIVDAAKHDDRIRAVVLNGSRVNPNAPRDAFQDFDVVYFVTDIGSFKDDPAWIDRFGERMILQMPDTMLDPPPIPGHSFAYLVQFTDGNRLDLTLYPIAHLEEHERDSLSRLLLDKDGRLAPFAPPSERDFLPQAPTAKAFADCCNEFWWVCPYVAKGLWREQILYAKAMLDGPLREQLMKMLTWYVGVKTRFSRNPGKCKECLPQYLEPELWAMLEKTYAGASHEDTWDALQVMGDLFRLAARHVAARCGLEYPQGEDDRVSAHVRHVRRLPKDATEVY